TEPIPEICFYPVGNQKRPSEYRRKHAPERYSLFRCKKRENKRNHTLQGRPQGTEDERMVLRLPYRFVGKDKQQNTQFPLGLHLRHTATKRLLPIAEKEKDTKRQEPQYPKLILI